MNDVIIVGAGTAGSVLAERLSRSGKLKVLLIEAGGNPSSPFVKIPAGFNKLFKKKLDWNFESEPQPRPHGRRVFIPRGKMLGGSSNLNAQIHQWCHPADYDGWSDAGATGWSWQDVAPVFRAQECWSGEESNGPRGRNGPMHISENLNANLLSRGFVEAARSVGFGHQAAYNGGAYVGAWLAEITHYRGKRFSAYDAYLKPAMTYPNLEVMKHAQVLRVEMSEGRATGVTIRQGGVEKTLKARGVVLSAGAFGSPHILMHSGIGPAEHLRLLGIPVHFDSPEVGQNLQDHPLGINLFKVRGADTFKSAESPLNLLRYLFFKRGMLASNAVEALAFDRSKHAVSAPDIQLLFAPLEWRNEGLEFPKLDAISIAAIVAAPRSRGCVRLKSANPMDVPLIDLGLLSDPDGIDTEVMLAGTRLARKVAASAGLKDYVTEEMFPGANLQNDAELLDMILTRLQTVYHPSSTCRMGSDERAVVDPTLQVKGVGGLWVADASVMPSLTRGHPNAAVAMIGYRGAEMISARFE